MSMPVRALFFAVYRERLGVSELPVDIGDGATVADLVAALRARGTPFDALPVDPAVAVNRTYVPLTESLRPGDEVAFIPPVAGGS